MSMTNNDSCFPSRLRSVGSLLTYLLLLSMSPSVCHGLLPTTTTTTTMPMPRTSIQLSPSPLTATTETKKPHRMQSKSLSLKVSSMLDTSSSDNNVPHQNQRTSTALSSTSATPLPRILNRELASSSTKNYQWTKQNMAIALPALMGLLADPVLSMVDTAFVGRSGAIDLAALGVCTSIFHMAFTVFRASTVATTSLVGSAPDEASKRQITKLSLQLAGVLGTITLLGLRLGGGHVLSTMGVPSDSPMYKPACDYLYARCWAAPAVVGIVVAEGAFRGNDDFKTPLIACSVAALINLVLDPILMFPMGLGMAGAAAATAISQFGAFGVYGWRLWKRKLLPQPMEKLVINRAKVIKSILGANMAMLTKQGSMLVFYTVATALATRMGPAHVATHQVALSLFWLVTYWLDSGSVSGQVLMSKSISTPEKARSLTKYMIKYALVQGLAFSALVTGIGKFVPGLFTSDATIQSFLIQCLPHLAMQQTLVSVTLVLEGLAMGGNQFRYMAMGTTAATVAGLLQLVRATSVVGIWASAVNTFFGCRLLNAMIGVARVHLKLNKDEKQGDTIVPATTA